VEINNKLSVSIILPTLNELENIKKLIPEINNELEEINDLEQYQIIVVDDNSEDETENYLKHQIKETPDIFKYLIRKDNRSLSESILDGIKYSDYDYVIWLDADGSMDAKSIGKLVNVQNINKSSVIIGSRFVEGGGYKGIEGGSAEGIISASKQVFKSKDSVLGLILSIFFNKLLLIILPTGVKDITSGFISINKKLINDNTFLDKNYGEYFIYLVTDILIKKQNIIEVGYICKTREYGESKTAPSLIKLIKRGLPYIKAANKSRRNLKNAYKR
jgi:dolichol-phosphate mannosyltransferase